MTGACVNERVIGTRLVYDRCARACGRAQTNGFGHGWIQRISDVSGGSHERFNQI